MDYQVKFEASGYIMPHYLLLAADGIRQLVTDRFGLEGDFPPVFLVVDDKGLFRLEVPGLAFDGVSRFTLPYNPGELWDFHEYLIDRYRQSVKTGSLEGPINIKVGVVLEV